MPEITNSFRNVQVKFRRGNPLTKVIIIVAITLTTIALITLRLVQNDIEAETQRLKEEAAQLVEENDDLQDKIDDLGSVHSVIDIAQSELDYADPDTTFFAPQGSEDN